VLLLAGGFLVSQLWAHYLGRGDVPAERRRLHLVWARNVIWSVVLFTIVSVWASTIPGFALSLAAVAGATLIAKPDRGHADNAERLAKVALDGNRRLLACLPIEPDASGAPCLVRRAQDGRRALRLQGDAQTNLLTRALADDPHFGPYMAIPGKDNGFDIEGLAVALTESLPLPHGRGTNRAEAICDLEGEHTVFRDLLRHD
jgi:hypothetical protein